MKPSFNLEAYRNMKLYIILVACLIVAVSGTWNRRPTPKQSCNLPPDSGQCSSWLRRFYYNTATGRCEEFHYKGCKGNANRFKTFRECSDICCHQGNSGGTGGWNTRTSTWQPSGGNGGSGGVWVGGNGGSSWNGGNGGSGGVWNGGNGGNGGGSVFWNGRNFNG
ncbi:uncharacterized protein [Mytilus edulis]|uniref:uncharacterized protein n=1 Tax=Mytilus edulis TaxID=6550 RepID=UPI0039EFE862